MASNKIGISETVNSLSTGLIAIFFSHVLHELTHLITALAVGAEARRFNLFAVDIELYNDSFFLWHDIAIEAGASIMNLLAGFIALLLFYSVKEKPGVLWRQFFLQAAGYNFLMGFGYFLFDSLFYSPDIPGDWRSVITMLDGSVALRVVLMIIGTAGMLFAFFWLARSVLVFVTDKNSTESRFAAAFPVLMVPYIAFGIIYSILSIWHPVGFPDGLIITVLQFGFGFSGLLWAFFLAVYWLKPKEDINFGGELPRKISKGWLISALVIFLIEVFIMLPTIDL